jgi:hypothetical protein
MAGTQRSGHELNFKEKKPVGQPIMWWLNCMQEGRKEVAERKMEGFWTDRRDSDL